MFFFRIEKEWFEGVMKDRKEKAEVKTQTAAESSRLSEEGTTLDRLARIDKAQRNGLEASF